MYADKLHKKDIFPIQTKKPRAISRRYEGKSPLYTMDVIQLKDDESEVYKLIPSAHGSEPISGLGLTFHHIIPHRTLTYFYIICKNCNDFDVQKELATWEKTALASADATSKRRENTICGNANENANANANADNVQVATYSACMGMNGNIFIGPNPEYRIDDLGDKFDYGGFRVLSGNSSDKGAINPHNSNERMENKYDKFREILNKYRSLRSNPRNNNVNDSQFLNYFNNRIDITKINKRNPLAGKYPWQSTIIYLY